MGSVVDLEGDTIPAWAAGKCTPVPEGVTPNPETMDINLVRQLATALANA